MANLPTAYASQDFGRKTLDFYAAAGEVSGADPRARDDEHSLTDYDGAKHTVRVMDRDFALEAGDQASVLRMQMGPSRRSRPVAVVNHTRQGWSRTHPGASAMLSRAGVARNVNWFLTVLLFALASMVMVWPYLRSFLVEVDPSVFGAAPAFNIFALALSALPDLGNWSFSQSVSPVSTLIAQSVPSMAEQADQIVFYALSGLAALVVFATRSWRLLWAPLFVGLVAAAALGLGGVTEASGYAVIAYGLSAVIFVVGGLINRIRDAARLERRIALLADHLQRHAPEETIARTDASDTEAEAPDALSEETTEDDASMAAVTAPVSAALSDSAGEPRTDENQADETRIETADEPASDLSDDADIAVSEADGQADASPVLESPTDAEAAALSEPIEQDTDAEGSGAAHEEDAAAVSEDAEVASEVAAEAEPENHSAQQHDPELALVEAEPPIEEEAGAVNEEIAVDASAEASVTAAEPNAERGEAAPEDEGDVEAELQAPSDTAADAESDALTSQAAEDVEPALSVAAEEPAANEAGDAPEAEPELAGLEAEEAERMKNDPRYAARAIVLPSPPPMPTAEDSDNDALTPAQPTTRETRELRPSEPLTNRVLSLFSNPVVPPAPPAPPAPSRSQEDEDA